MKFSDAIDILYVEDDDVDIESMQRAFRKTGIRNKLHVANDGLQALRLLRGGSIFCPRIVLLDINMPRMNGLEFLVELRRDPALKHLAVFVLTTSDQDRDLGEAHRSGIAGYFVKPSSMAGLIATVQTLNGLWQATEFVPDRVLTAA